MVGDNFQQKMAEILAWFEKKILGAGGLERQVLENAKSAMLQFNYAANSSMGTIIQHSLPPKNNEVLEEHPNTLLSGIKGHIPQYQPNKRNRQPGK